MPEKRSSDCAAARSRDFTLHPHPTPSITPPQGVHAPQGVCGGGPSRYLPAAVAEQQQRQGDGGARHGVRGGHAVLGAVEHLQLHHGRRGGPRPADHVLGALPHVHHPHPDDHQPPAQPRVHVPDAAGEEEDVEELVAQLRAQAEQVVQQPAAGGELLAAFLLLLLP